MITYIQPWTIPRWLQTRPEWVGPWRYTPPAGLESGLWSRLDKNGTHYYVLPNGNIRIDR